MEKWSRAFRDFKKVERVIESLFTGVRGQVLRNEILSKHTSLKVGGKASAFIYPKDVEDLKDVFKIISQHKIPYFVLGDGSNFLPSDDDFNGVVLNLSKLNKVEIIEKETACVAVYVEAGVSKQKLLFWAIESGFSGLEFLSGVPGQVGGGLFMNAGTHRGSFSDVTQKVKLLNMHGTIEEHLVTPNDFSYRAQSFSKNRIIISAVLKLGYGDPKKMTEEVKLMIADRKSKQPLQQPNCGSVFKNPEGTTAGKIIEECGLKGFRIGDAMVSQKHGNFIVNLGNAKSQDIRNVIDHVKKVVTEKKAIQLKEEVVMMES